VAKVAVEDVRHGNWTAVDGICAWN
jgi:hypothetical protein